MLGCKAVGKEHRTQFNFLFFCVYRVVESWRSRALGLYSFVLRDLLLLSCFSFERRIKCLVNFSSRVIASATDLFVCGSRKCDSRGPVVDFNMSLF